MYDFVGTVIPLLVVLCGYTCMYDFVGNFAAGDLGDEETDRSDSDAVPRGGQVSG